MTERPPETVRHCLLVSCHPLADSLCNHLVERVKQGLAGPALTVEHLDLYDSGFAAPLSAAERQSYFAGDFDAAGLAAPIAALRRAESLILVFPTWWFGMPALLKGWFDRVWAPGVAFDHPVEPGGRITPRLDGLKHCLVITTLGSPWWFNTLILRRPLRRILKTGVIGPCAPAMRFRMLCLYSAMALEPPRLERFLYQIDRAVQGIAGSTATAVGRK